VTCRLSSGQNSQCEKADKDVLHSVSRRELITQAPISAASVTAALLAWEDIFLVNPALAEGGEPRNIVITGSNSGIGFNGAKKLAAQGNHVTLACRTLAKAEAAKEAIERELGEQLKGSVTAAECDLADLSSVRGFASAWLASGAPLDVLVCNGGLQYSGDNAVRRTKDGFEITVGTNHLGHFLLTNLLLDAVELSAGPGKIVVTASEVHNPESPGGSVGPAAGLGDLRGLATNGAAFEMIDGSEYNADKAYKDSKLCNVLFTLELQRRLAARGSAVTVNCYGPGLITRTGFFRNQQPVFVKLFDFATNDIFHVAETVDGGGDCLVYMVNSSDLNGRGGLYYNNGLAPLGKHSFKELAPSVESQNEAEAAMLWEYSAKLVNLS